MAELIDLSELQEKVILVAVSTAEEEDTPASLDELEELGLDVGGQLADLVQEDCYDTFETAQENAYKTFEEKGLQVSVIDHDAAVAACRPVIDKYCENEDSKAIYDYVMKVREELGIPNN